MPRTSRTPIAVIGDSWPFNVSIIIYKSLKLMAESGRGDEIQCLPQFANP
jgi:hypothetical protein